MEVENKEMLEKGAHVLQACVRVSLVVDFAVCSNNKLVLTKASLILRRRGNLDHIF